MRFEFTVCMRTFLILFSLFGIVSSADVFACGFCSGDRAASVYSFKNKKFADRVHGRYVSVEISGQGTAEDFARALEVLRKLPGVYGKTVRGAYAQKAASFVLRSRTSFETAAEKFSKESPGWNLKLVEENS